MGNLSLYLSVLYLRPCAPQEIWMSQHSLPTLTVSIDLGVFEALASSPSGFTASELACKLDLAERPVSALLGVLVSLKMVDSDASSGGCMYSLGPVANTYLLKGSPYFWGPMLLGLSQRSALHNRLMTVRVLSRACSPSPAFYPQNISL